MKKPALTANTLTFLRALYVKLVNIYGSPQKVSFGFGLGVFCGIIPGIGPLTALFLASLLRANRASALLGALATNTWLSFVTFVLSIKVGSVILRVNWQDVYSQWLAFLRGFRLERLFTLAAIKIMLPLAIGYILVSLVLGAAVYLLGLAILTAVKYESKN